MKRETVVFYIFFVSRLPFHVSHLLSDIIKIKNIRKHSVDVSEDKTEKFHHMRNQRIETTQRMLLKLLNI